MTVSTDTEMSNAERDKLMSKAYTSAGSDLRRLHQREFNELYQSHCAEFGITWTPKKSKQDAALEQMVELLNEFPALAERLAKRLAEDKIHHVNNHEVKPTKAEMDAHEAAKATVTDEFPDNEGEEGIARDKAERRSKTKVA